MSLDLDEETLAELCWGSDVSDSTTHYVSAPKPSRTPEGQIDGRHRRNWRRRATQSPETGSGVTIDTSGGSGHG